MRGTRLRDRGRRSRRWVAFALLTAVSATGGVILLPATPASADTAILPGTMSTAAQNTSSFAVHVPAGVTPSAITGVLTMSEVVSGGQVVFSVNGRQVLVEPSSLYRKVTIPVLPTDVIADGTIGLTMQTLGLIAPGTTCFPSGGVASLRKIGLDYTGVETAPTTIGTFFPVAATAVSVQIPSDAGTGMVTAGLTAVAALASRYDDDTPVQLTLNAPTVPVAGARVVSLVEGRAGEVTTTVDAPSGIPTLTLTGTGDDLVDAARSLSTDTLGLSGSNAENPSQQAKPRSTDKTRTLSSLGVPGLTLSGYGSTTQEVELRQDSFGQPVESMRLHLEGTHTAFADASGARLDIRANGNLVGSAVMSDDATFSVDVSIPSGRLTSVNDLDLTLTALAPDGSACTPTSVPPAEVDVDTQESTVTVTPGTGEAKGFELFPQIFEGTLPVALQAVDGRQASAAINAAALVATLQRAAGSPLDIQVMEPEAFLADDRSGLIVGALNPDSVALDAPLKLSETRLLDRDDSTSEVTSQDPYAALESIDRNNRLVLMLGSWAPGNKAATGTVVRKVVDYVVNQGWASLEGDLVIADEASPAFALASRSLAPHEVVVEKKSYAKWFIAVIAVLLLLLALQVVVAVRRDREVARADDERQEGEPLEGDDEDYDVDQLGDVDDLDVMGDVEEREVVDADLDEDADWDEAEAFDVEELAGDPDVMDQDVDLVEDADVTTDDTDGAAIEADDATDGGSAAAPETEPGPDGGPTRPPIKRRRR